MVTISSGSLSSGASIATEYTRPTGVTVTRGDIVGPATRYNLKTVERTANTNSYLFPMDLSTAHFMTIGISETTRTSIGGGTVSRGTKMKTATEYIRLPLPESIKDVNEVSYTEEGAVSASALASAIVGLGSNQQGANPAQEGLGIISGIVGFFGKAGFAAELKARTGLAPNQMLTVLLKGPKYKTHSFSWKLYPRNYEESVIIKNIISTLKKKSRPGLDSLGAFFTFPHIFDLSFTINNVRDYGNGYFFSFKIFCNGSEPLKKNLLVLNNISKTENPFLPTIFCLLIFLL